MGEGDRTDLADTVTGWSGGGPVPGVLERGHALGRYTVLEMLGAGGMGVVYAAYDPELDRKVAVKLVRHDPTALGGTDGRARMLREAQAIARLAHPNVVTVHDVGTALDQVFVAMELVEGETVTAWLRAQPRSLAEILEVFAQAGRGLAAAHRAGLVHRDFKPDNVLVGHDGRVRVVDFGLVREQNEALPPEPVAVEAEAAAEPPSVPMSPGWRMLAVPLTQVGTLMGTPYYMAPEQFERLPTDARTDQYNYCASLYEAIHGTPPYVGADITETASKVLAGELPESPSDRKVPPHVRSVLRRGLSVAPAARFASMDEVLAELGRDPRARRRRWLAAAAAVVVAGGAAAALLSARGGAPPAPCGGGEDRIAEAWNPARRAALEKAFSATGVPYAADSAAAVGRSLDRYAATWVRSHEDSCQATRVRGEQSEEMLDLRGACLARRRSELDALVNLLVAADAGIVQRAATAAESLSPVATCDDVAALQAPVPPPPGVARLAVAEMRGETARVQALLLAGRFSEGLAQAGALRARARALAYRPLEAEVDSVLAQFQSRSGDAAAAIGTLVQALAEATAGRHDEAAVRIAIQLVQASANDSQFERGHDWITLADGLLVRIGDPPDRRAGLHHTTGYLLSSEGKLAAAAEEHRRALAIRERIAPGSLEMARSLSSLSYVYDELGRYKEARAFGERSLAIEVVALGASHPDVAQLLNNLGNVADDEGDYALAISYYRRSLAIREKTVPAGDDPGSLASVLNNLGVVAFEQGHDDESLGFQRRALAVREKIDPESPEVAMSLVNIAAVVQRQGDDRSALDGYRRSLAIAEKALGKDHPYVGDALSGIGQCTRALGQLEESQAVLERALVIRRAGARPVEVADVEFALARTLWDRGRARARALELARSARAAYAGTPAGKRSLAEVETWLRAHDRR